MNILSVRNLNSYYGSAQALFEISLDLFQNEILSLVGANGAGKSTLLKTISGLILNRSGDIVLDGKSIIYAPADKIVGLGIAHVPEGRRLFPGMTVMDNLLMGAYLRKNKEDIKKDLEYVFEIFPRLKERRNQLAGKLSGGEQQMCAIGRGIMSSPKILLIDELSLGLAPKIVDELIEIVAVLRRRGISIVLVEQVVQIGLEISDRAYVIEHGKIVMTGLSKDLLINESIRKAYLGI